MITFWRGTNAKDVSPVDEAYSPAEIDAATLLDGDLAGYRQAMRLIVEDDAIQGGVATFRGTRILVHQVAELLAHCADVAELYQDYPRLTPAMLEAASIYARAHPGRGRPRVPAWRKDSGTEEAVKQHGE